MTSLVISYSFAPPQRLHTHSQYGDLAFVPYADVVLKLPLVVPAAARIYMQARQKLDAFGAHLLAHIRALHAQGQLNEQSFGAALLEFGQQDGVTEEDLVSEINIMFLAGEGSKRVNIHTVVVKNGTLVVFTSP